MDKFEPRLSISGPIKKDRLLFGQYLQYRYVRTPVKSLPGEPALGLDSFDSFTRLDARPLVAAFAHRRRHLLPAQDHQRDDLDLPPARDDAEVHAVRLLGGLRRSADPRRHTSCSRSTFAGRAVRSRPDDQGHAADGLRAADAERQLLQPPGAQRPQPAARRSAHDVEGLLAGQHVFKVGVDVQHSRLRRRRLQPAARRPAARRVAGRADDVRAGR